MIQRVKNIIEITCNDIDFTQASNMEVYINQGDTTFTYGLTAQNEHKAVFEIPKEDAMDMDNGIARIQFAVTIEDEAVVSNIVKVSVLELLKEEGYGD